MSTAIPPVLQAEGLVVRYRYQDQPVLRGLDVQLAAGERVAIMGPSGCGKSTLLAHLAALRDPQAGLLHWQGARITGMAEAARDALRGRTLGFVFQRAGLIPYLSAQDNLALALLPGAEAAAARLPLLIEALGLGAVARQPAALLSVGESQRVALARALLRQPPLILADEPTGALDGANVEALLHLLFASELSGHAALLIATHDARVAARCTRVLHLREGRLHEA